jgi:SAM-dependent methyltransferase
MSAEYFDQWHADQGASPDRDAIIARAMGLPPELRGAGTLTWSGLAEVTDALRLSGDSLLLDVACGRGGYGVEVARRTGARLIGVDFSAVAVAQASTAAADRLSPGRASFVVGTLTETGQPDQAADAVMCLDAIQFAGPPLDGLRELRRVLQPGGRLVLTCWESAGSERSDVPARIQAMNLRRDLPAAGFTEVHVEERPDWDRAEREMWESVLAATDPDPAMRSLQDEGRRSLSAADAVRRVFATATAP